MHEKDEAGDEGPVYRRRFDAGRPRSMSLAVAEAIESVARGEGAETEATDDRSLYDLVDPDALDALFGPRSDGLPRTLGSVTLPLTDHEVRVHAGGLVEVYATRSDGSAPRE